MKFEYGSLQESIAIVAYARSRSVAYMASAIAVVDPGKAGEAVKQFRGILFPEEGYDELSYVKKSKELFERLKNVDLFGSSPKKG